MNARIFELNYGATPAQVVKSVYATGITESNELALKALIELMSDKEAKEKERAERRREIAAKRSLSFKKELYEILETRRNHPMTPTEVQFVVHNFVERYITNQKVAYHLSDMLCRADFPELERFVYHGKVYYVVGEIPLHVAGPLYADMEW